MVNEGKSGVTSHGWHSIESAFRCEKEYQYEKIRKIRKPEIATPEHFAVGSLFHAGRAKWFALQFEKSTKTMGEIREAIEAEAYRQKLPTPLQAERRALELVEQYVEHWSMRPLPTAVATEYELSEEIDGFPRTARLDDVSVYAEASGALCIGESKTTSTSVFDTVNQYTLHGQIMLQLLLWELAPQGKAKLGPIAGVMLDVTKKGYGKERAQFGRELIVVPPTALAWYRRELGFKSRELETARDGGRFGWDTDAERNPNACTRMIGRARVACTYRDLCLHGRAAATQFVLEDGRMLTQHEWAPGEEAMPWD